MKALTLTQPWASLMAVGAKTIETRSWETMYRGGLVIHAAKGFPRWARDFSREPPVSVLFGPDYEFPLSRGLCVVRLIGCFRTDESGMRKLAFAAGRKPSLQEIQFGDFSEGRFAWLTQFVRPIRCETQVRGALGLWEWPEEVE